MMPAQPHRVKKSQARKLQKEERKLKYFYTSVRGNDDCGGPHLEFRLRNEIEKGNFVKLVLGDDKLPKPNHIAKDPYLTPEQIQKNGEADGDAWYEKNKYIFIKLLSEQAGLSEIENLFNGKNTDQSIALINTLAEKSGLSFEVVRWKDWTKEVSKQQIRDDAKKNFELDEFRTNLKACTEGHFYEQKLKELKDIYQQPTLENVKKLFLAYSILAWEFFDLFADPFEITEDVHKLGVSEKVYFKHINALYNSVFSNTTSAKEQSTGVLWQALLTARGKATTLSRTKGSIEPTDIHNCYVAYFFEQFPLAQEELEKIHAELLIKVARKNVEVYVFFESIVAAIMADKENIFSMDYPGKQLEPAIIAMKTKRPDQPIDYVDSKEIKKLKKEPVSPGQQQANDLINAIFKEQQKKPIFKKAKIMCFILVRAIWEVNFNHEELLAFVKQLKRTFSKQKVAQDHDKDSQETLILNWLNNQANDKIPNNNNSLEDTGCTTDKIARVHSDSLTMSMCGFLKESKMDETESAIPSGLTHNLSSDSPIKNKSAKTKTADPKKIFFEDLKKCLQLDADVANFTNKQTTRVREAIKKLIASGASKSEVYASFAACLLDAVKPKVTQQTEKHFTAALIGYLVSATMTANSSATRLNLNAEVVDDQSLQKRYGAPVNK